MNNEFEKNSEPKRDNGFSDDGYKMEDVKRNGKELTRRSVR